MSDADDDGMCDREDRVCNPDGQPIICDAVPPQCREGEVPEASNGCFTGCLS